MQNHRRPVNIKFGGYSKRNDLFQKVLQADSEKSKVKRIDANSGIFYEVDQKFKLQLRSDHATSFNKQKERPVEVKREYPIEIYDSAQRARKIFIEKKPKQALQSFDKFQGRDNSFYFVNEGNNLNPKDDYLNQTTH